MNFLSCHCCLDYGELVQGWSLGSAGTRKLCLRESASDRGDRFIHLSSFYRLLGFKSLKRQGKSKNMFRGMASLPFFARAYSFASYGLSVIHLLQDSL